MWLADLVFTDDFPDRYADATGPSEGAAIDPLGDDAQVMFGGGEQFVAFAGPLAGQGGVAAGDQPFPWVVGRAISARSWVSNRLICSGPSAAASAAIWGARSAVIHPKSVPLSMSSRSAAMRGGDHAPVADQHQPL